MIGLSPSRCSWPRARRGERGSARWRTWIAAANLAGALLASLTPVARADSQALATSLQDRPVQSISVPKSSFTALSPAKLGSLSREIARLDPGRIWILIVSPRDDAALSRLADPVFGDLPAGTLMAVATDPKHPSTTNWWVGSSWQSSAAAQRELNNVIQGYHKGQGSFFDDLRLEVHSFAKGDAAAGHPPLASTGNPAPPPSSGGGSGSDVGNSSGSSFPLGLVITGVTALILIALVGGRYARQAARSSHWDREKSADAHAKAQADFIKLGEEIAALDIDSSLANASPEGKDEYRHALGCYEKAEQRLKQADDDYQFQTAVWAIKAGRRHVLAAQQLFNPQPGRKRQMDELTRLIKLHRSGALSDDEFAEREEKLLS